MLFLDILIKNRRILEFWNLVKSFEKSQNENLHGGQYMCKLKSTLRKACVANNEWKILIYYYSAYKLEVNNNLKLHKLLQII